MHALSIACVSPHCYLLGLNLIIALFFVLISNLGAGASVFRLQNQDGAVSEDGVHESNDSEPPHRKIRTWRPTKDRQQQSNSGNKVKPHKKKDKEGYNAAKIVASSEGSGITHQHMLSIHQHSSVSQHKDVCAGTGIVVNPGQDNMGIIHQDMLRGRVQQDSQGA